MFSGRFPATGKRQNGWAEILRALGAAPWRHRRLKWCLPVLLASSCSLGHAQSELPEAPTPQPDLVASVPAEDRASIPLPDGFPASAAGQQTFPPQATRHPGITLPGLQSNYVPLPQRCTTRASTQLPQRRSCCQPDSEVFESYLKEMAVHVYSPDELGHLALHGIIDPFNLLTIAGISAYSVAVDSHSPYGPGMNGFWKESGVTVTQQMTAEFFGTFLIPSLDHQDPHYHRLPNASLKRRIAHCVYQVFWTDSDEGKGMLNYSSIAGTIADEAVGVLYVPYQQVGWGPSAARIGTAWATAPIGNLVTEFVPDVARHINLNIVLLQRIINRVAIEEGAGAP